MTFCEEIKKYIAKRKREEEIRKLTIWGHNLQSKDKELYDSYAKIINNENTTLCCFLLFTRDRKHVLTKLKDFSNDELLALTNILNNHIFKQSRSKVEAINDKLRNGERITVKEDDIWLLFYVLDYYLEVREVVALVDKLFNIDWKERKNRVKGKMNNLSMLREKWRTYQNYKKTGNFNKIISDLAYFDRLLSEKVPKLKKKA